MNTPRVTNNSNISLSLAVWLLHDEYDYINEPNYISVTGLMKPLRQIIIPPRIPPQEQIEDVEDHIARQMGHALHHSVEHAWIRGYAQSLRKLGIPESVIEKVRINPTDEEVSSDSTIIPIYLEQRAIRDFEGYRIGGKFDMVAEGHVEDNKSTSAWSWVFGTRDEEHILQGSLYRWIDSVQPKPKITEDFMRINYIFTDWQKMLARSKPDYPQKRVAHKDLKLMSLDETENWVRNKLALIAEHRSTPEFMLPECTDEELWRSEPQYKFYLDPNKTDGRATRNFDDIGEARKYQSEEKGGRGVIITKPGEPKRCELYCNAFNGCTQKDQYFS